MKLTKNFSLEEFACKDGSPIPENLIPNIQALAENLQVLRDFLETPLHINSGYRSESYNKKIGGAPLSQHKLGRAADISCAKYTPPQVYVAITTLIKSGKMHNGGLGRYNSFTHYDIRETPARWDLRNT